MKTKHEVDAEYDKIVAALNWDDNELSACAETLAWVLGYTTQPPSESYIGED